VTSLINVIRLYYEKRLSVYDQIVIIKLEKEMDIKQTFT